MRIRQVVKDAAIYIIVPSCFFIAAPALAYLLIYLLSVSILLLIKGRWPLLIAGCCSMGALLWVTQTIMNPDLLSRAWERYLSSLDRTQENLYLVRSLEAIHEGGLWGKGFGVAAPNQLPGIASEMTYSYLIYSLGWIFGIAVAVIALLFLLRIAKMGMQLKDGYAKGLVCGLTSVLGIQYIWTLLMCTGMLPILDGMQMPIMNWASGTLIELGAVGLMLGAYRRKDMLGSSSLLQKTN